MCVFTLVCYCLREHQSLCIFFLPITTFLSDVQIQRPYSVSIDFHANLFTLFDMSLYMLNLHLFVFHIHIFLTHTLFKKSVL